MARRVRTGCSNHKCRTNSSAAEFVRQQGKLWANVATLGGVAGVQTFTADFRGCGHTLSPHDQAGDELGNSYAALVGPQSPARSTGPPVVAAPSQVPPGWNLDPGKQPCSRWRGGIRWTDATAPR